MPQRFLRPGITDSAKWNACDWEVQSFYIRLITLVDDFGRYEANPKLLRGHAFALREDITSSMIIDMCKQLQGNDLADFYEVAEKQYVQIANWIEKARADKSKFPAKDDSCKQMFSNDSKCSPPSSSSSSPPSDIANAILSGKPDPVYTSARILIHFLNELTGAKFRESNASFKHIVPRLKEPDVDLEGCKTMVSRQVKMWKGTEMEKYLRPETLFNSEKFNSYYATKDQPIPQSTGSHKPASIQPNYSKGF